MNSSELEDRLIDFAASTIKFTYVIPKNQAGTVLSNQIVKSGTSSALNYGEARAAESPKDFKHKIRIVLKELRETLINLKIIQKSIPLKDQMSIEYLIKENNELVAIFVSTIKTIENKTIKKS